MSNTPQAKLDQVRAFVASHGHDAWIEGAAVCFTSWCCKTIPTSEGWTVLEGSWHREVSVVHTIADAKKALGY